MKAWIREGRLRAFKTPGGHARIPVDEFQRFLRRHWMPTYPTPPPPTGVLVVDDEPQVVEILVEFLTHHPRGFKVETASDGYEALIAGLARGRAHAVLPKPLALDAIESCLRPLVDSR